MAALFSLPPGLMMKVRLLSLLLILYLNFMMIFEDGKSSTSILSSRPASLLLSPILIFFSPCLPIFFFFPISSSSSFTAFPPSGQAKLITKMIIVPGQIGMRPPLHCSSVFSTCKWFTNSTKIPGGPHSIRDSLGSRQNTVFGSIAVIS